MVFCCLFWYAAWSSLSVLGKSAGVVGKLKALCSNYVPTMVGFMCYFNLILTGQHKIVVTGRHCRICCVFSIVICYIYFICRSVYGQWQLLRCRKTFLPWDLLFILIFLELVEKLSCEEIILDCTPIFLKVMPRNLLYTACQLKFSLQVLYLCAVVAFLLISHHYEFWIP